MDDRTVNATEAVNTNDTQADDPVTMFLAIVIFLSAVIGEYIIYVY